MLDYANPVELIDSDERAVKYHLPIKARPQLTQKPILSPFKSASWVYPPCKVGESEALTLAAMFFWATLV